jgi:hypothetical protein
MSAYERSMRDADEGPQGPESAADEFDKQMAKILADREDRIERERKRYWRAQWADLGWVILGARPTRIRRPR